MLQVNVGVQCRVEVIKYGLGVVSDKESLLIHF